MAIMVTGGLGNIGICLTKQLAEMGEEVVCYQRSTSLRADFDQNYIKEYVEEEKVKIVSGSTLDLPRMIETIKKYNVESIAHLALIGGYHEIPYLSIKNTVTAMLNVLELARQLDLRRVIYTSSGAVYPNVGYEGTCKEDTPFPQYAPYGVYTVMKCCDDMIGLNYADEYGVDFASCRIATNYGPPRIVERNSPGAGSLADMIINSLNDKPTILETGADHKIPYVYVLDTAEGLTKVLKADKLKHKVYNIAGGQIPSLSETAEIVKKLIPEANIKVGPGMLPTTEWQRPPFNLNRMYEDFGFIPKHNELEKGATAYIEWLRKAKTWKN